MRPFSHILLSAVLSGIVSAVVWLVVCTVVEGGLPAKGVARDGKDISVSKQLIERGLMSFFSGFIVALMLTAFQSEPIPQTESVKRDLARAQYKIDHPQRECRPKEKLPVEPVGCPFKQQ